MRLPVPGPLQGTHVHGTISTFDTKVDIVRVRVLAGAVLGGFLIVSAAIAQPVSAASAHTWRLSSPGTGVTTFRATQAFAIGGQEWATTQPDRVLHRSGSYGGIVVRAVKGGYPVLIILRVASQSYPLIYGPSEDEQGRKRIPAGEYRISGFGDRSFAMQIPVQGDRDRSLRLQSANRVHAHLTRYGDEPLLSVDHPIRLRPSTFAFALSFVRASNALVNPRQEDHEVCFAPSESTSCVNEPGAAHYIATSGSTTGNEWTVSRAVLVGDEVTQGSFVARFINTGGIAHADDRAVFSVAVD